jgi:hypothetical protein
MERINHFLFISYGKNSFSIRPVWYKSKDLERIKDVYQGTTVYKTIVLPLFLYWFETWSLTQREEHRLRLFENIVEENIGHKREEVSGVCRKSHTY